MRALLLLLAAAAAAQNFTQPTQSFAPSATVNGTAIVDPTLFATPLVMNVENMWDLLVGPVSSAYVTTTVEPTPVPATSLIPPPPLYYSPFPTGQQVPMVVKNESWSFPKDFWWRVAGAAFQIEGAVKVDGRGPSIWDVLSHRVTDNIAYNFTADVADNNYYMYKEDIARIAAMGVKTYSFTLSWSRIFPFGRGPVNELAIAHYNDVIDTCIRYNVTPMVTLYHWDLPLYLQDAYGGWLSENVVNDFVAYAKIAFTRFGDRVNYWFTINEPIVFCGQYPLPAGYFKTFDIPDIEQKFYCGQSVLLAHSQAYHLGKSMMPNSIITYKNNGGYKIPLTNSSADAQAVQRAWDFNEGWFSDPIYLTGDYPASVKQYVSRFLRPFSSDEKRSIKGSSDLYAHDAYTSSFYFAPDSGISSCLANATNPLYPSCANTSNTYSARDGGWNIGPAADPRSPWLHKATDWVPVFLHYLQDTWAGPANVPVAVTEFGFAEPFEFEKVLLQDILFDAVRSSYFHDYMEAILIAISEGVKVAGCLAWSFVDNFEWNEGYASKFGMQYVNYSDPMLPRYYKASFFEYTNAFKMYQEQ